MSATSGGEPSILARTAASAGWLVGLRFASRLLGLVSTLVLLRLLTPEDFGLVTMAFTFSAAAEALTAIGADVQLIRSRDLRPDLYDTAFTLNVIRAAAVAAIVVAGSGPVAAWFNEPRLVAVLLAIAFTILLKGLVNVRTTLFVRELDFRKLFLLHIVPRLAQVASSIVLAVALRTYWALIAAIIVSAAVMLVFSYALVPVRPRLTLAAWRELLSVSLWTWLANVATVFRDRAEMVMVGRVFGVVAAGLYAIALEFALLPMSEIVAQIGHAAMPGLAASLRTEGEGHAVQAYRRILALAVLLSVAMGAGLSLVSGPFIALAMGRGWAEAAPLMAVMALMLIPMGPGLTASALLSAHGRFRELFVITGVAAALRALTVVLLTRHLELRAIALGMGVVVMIEAGLLLDAARRRARLAWSDYAVLAWRALLAALAMAWVLQAAGLAWLPVPAGPLAAALPLFAASGLGALVFASVMALLWLAAGRPPGPERDLLTLLQRLLAKFRARSGG